MGGLHTLFIAELESRAKEKIGIDSYLSIHPPVDIYSSMTILDNFWDKWHAWKPEDAPGKVESAIAAYLNLAQYGLPKDKRIPISPDRAKVLIAYAYRNALQELLLAISKQKNDMGFLKEEYGFTKDALYKEISQFSFAKVETRDFWPEKRSKHRLVTDLLRIRQDLPEEQSNFLRTFKD